MLTDVCYLEILLVNLNHRLLLFAIRDQCIKMIHDNDVGMESKDNAIDDQQLETDDVEALLQ